MSVIAAALRELMAAGLSGDDLICAIERIEQSLPKQKEQSSAAIRQARYRERHNASQSVTKRNETSQSVTSDVTPTPFPAPPNENNLTPPTHTPVYKSRAREAFPILDCAEPQVWADFLKNRKAKKLPCTETAHRKLERDLQRWALETGWPPGKVFETCVGKGWGAIYDPRDKANGNANRSGDSKTGLGRTFDAGQRVLERIHAMQANLPPGSDASIFDA